MKPQDFDKMIELNTIRIKGKPTYSRYMKFMVNDIDNCLVGKSNPIHLEWVKIKSKKDICAFDENGELLDYHFEKFNLKEKWAIISIYNDWKMDGKKHLIIAYN